MGINSFPNKHSVTVAEVTTNCDDTCSMQEEQKAFCKICRVLGLRSVVIKAILDYVYRECDI